MYVTYTNVLIVYEHIMAKFLEFLDDSSGFLPQIASKITTKLQGA